VFDPQQFRELCKKAATEQDPDSLGKLQNQIKEALAQWRLENPESHKP
jgi:hypothetical protein